MISHYLEVKNLECDWILMNAKEKNRDQIEE